MYAVKSSNWNVSGKKGQTEMCPVIYINAKDYTGCIKKK